MPVLVGAPEKIEEDIVPADRLPRTGAVFNLTLRLLSLPGMSRVGLLRTLLRRQLSLPSSVNLNPGFCCTSGRLHCGEGVDLADTFFLDFAPVYIGACTVFSYRNMVITAERDGERITLRPVVIGRNVWITSNVTVLPGVRIGDNSVIGAGSVVTRDIPADVLAVGNPCRPVKPSHRAYRLERDTRGLACGQPV